MNQTSSYLLDISDLWHLYYDQQTDVSLSIFLGSAYWLLKISYPIVWVWHHYFQLWRSFQHQTNSTM